MKLEFFICTCILLADLFHVSNSYEVYHSPSHHNNEQHGYYQRPVGVTNLTTIVGKTVLFNCSLSNNFGFSNNHASENLPSYPSSVEFRPKLNPTWLKADPIYDNMGCISSFNTENIIVTRKGIIASYDRDKMKLISPISNHFQSLQISNINVKSEGKYICREFNSPFDKLFYLNVYAPVTGLNLKFETPTKQVPQPFISDRIQMAMDENSIESSNNKVFFNSHDSDKTSITIKENEVLTVNCTVDVSKPAANISIWLVPSHRLLSDKNSRKLPLYRFTTHQNEDMTLSSVAIAKFVVNRVDNQKSVVCVAENMALDEKWESKRLLNVLYAPQCSQYQKKTYHTGINQTLDLECRMTDANPQYLDFDWTFANNQGHKDRTQSNGFISRVKWTPKKLSDFGEIKCAAANGLDSGECRINLLLGGAPNPPNSCYHKENNKTIIIECVPGFDQGDPEVYFYLLKKKSNDVLVEYARKRDSCSFLISNLILEEHMNEFFVYSSNKYGSNRDQAAKIVIENKEFLIKNSKKLQEIADEKSKRAALMILAVFTGIIIVSIFCCMLVKCHDNNIKLKVKKSSGNSSLAGDHHYNYENGYKYSTHEHYQTQTEYKSGVHIDDYKHTKKVYKNINNDKYNDTSSSDFDQDPALNYDRKKLYEKSKHQAYTPSILSNIQDLDMSPKSKRLSIKEKTIFESGCSRSMTEETTETDSDNYFKSDEFDGNSLSVDHQKLHLYSPIKLGNNTVSNTIKMNDINSNHNGIVYTISQSKPSIKPNVWYGNQTDDLVYSGVVERNLYNVERGFSTLEHLPATFKKSYESDNAMNNKEMDTNNEYRNYSDLLDRDNNYDEEREENKLLQWPQADIPQLYSNETISLDIDDDKILGVLV